MLLIHKTTNYTVVTNTEIHYSTFGKVLLEFCKNCLKFMEKIYFLNHVSSDSCFIFVILQSVQQ